VDGEIVAGRRAIPGTGKMPTFEDISVEIGRPCFISGELPIRLE
jgi:hypothetical protein